MKLIKRTLKLAPLVLVLQLIACNSGNSSSSSASAQWTWVGGSKTTNGLGIYGTQTIAASSNIPGARFGAISWTGIDGKFWLFGGSGYDDTAEDSGLGYLNDLWQYNPATNQWAWMKGSNINTKNTNPTATIGIYGIMGIAESSNQPGARLCPASWTDNEGKLWLFGGQGNSPTESGFFNDLWQYNPSTNQWTWINGQSSMNNHGTYGTKGSPAVSNLPGGRFCSLTWTDSSNNLWLFGGDGYDSASLTPGYLNDLWKYTPSTNEWTWVSGDSLTNVNGVYGIQGTQAPTNKPGGRIDAVGWIDSNDNLWLFGGKGEDANGTGVLTGSNLNDLWRYDSSSNQWTWMSGSNFNSAYGVFGTLGVASANSVPGARFRKIPLSWVDNSGNLWMFGGDGNGATSSGFLNDFWKYNATNNEWTWMGGSTESNAIGIYGTMGVASSQNIPGARGDSVGWIDSNKNIWIFGGAQTAPDTNLNDLWKYTN